MKTIKAVIFDLDGTLIDSMQIWKEVDYAFLSKRGIEPPENIFEDLKGGNSFEEVAIFFKKKFNLTETKEEIMNEWNEMVGEFYEKEVLLKEGVFEFIKILKQKKIILGVGSSNSSELVKKALNKNKILHYFDSFVTGRENIRGKPFPDIFLKVAHQLKINPENCLVIEDVLPGIRAAKKAKMTVWGIYDEYSKADRKLMEKEADFFADDFLGIIKKFLSD